MWHFLQCISLTVTVICLQEAFGGMGGKPTSPAPSSVMGSTSMPNLLNSKGQLIEFAYNPDKKSAQAELIRLMGSSALMKSEKKVLPTFPGGNVSAVFQPNSKKTTARSLPVIIVPLPSSSESSKTPSVRSPPVIYKGGHRCRLRHPFKQHRPHRARRPTHVGRPPPEKPGRPGHPGKPGRPEKPSMPGMPAPPGNMLSIQPESIEITSPYMEQQLDFLRITKTQLQCYIAPPTQNALNMQDLMGLWYLVRKVNSTEHGTNEKYLCEMVMYSQIGLTNTFTKVADVHYKHKWMTIHGNGTFIPPGILVIDWKVLSAPTVPVRLVFTILGADPKSWVVGYMCKNGHKHPQIVLQTRKKDIKNAKLQEAYNVMRSHNLQLDNMVCQTGF